ncbi:hypothetical protein LX87_05598 [Larkinella arboricola]|uniref:Uncharacterized protein n=2 Tax=Larkinella arboricola TaxID=643671 RepID=A0A327WJ88_LARAB|nr:hypothetical protein LX87_05598 [Larkinella arboricola]
MEAAQYIMLKNIGLPRKEWPREIRVNSLILKKKIQIFALNENNVQVRTLTQNQINEEWEYKFWEEVDEEVENLLKQEKIEAFKREGTILKTDVAVGNPLKFRKLPQNPNS